MVTFYSMVYGRDIPVVKDPPPDYFSLVHHEANYGIYTDGYGNYRAYRGHGDA